MMVWDLKDARRSGVTPNHKGPVWSLAFSQGDGTILASGTTALMNHTCVCDCMCMLVQIHLRSAVLQASTVWACL